MSREEVESLRSLVQESKRMEELTKAFYDAVIAKRNSQKPEDPGPLEAKDID